MSYQVKEIVYTLAGEGAQTGRAAVLCRFAGCNLWSGRDEDRTKAVCKFCDTDFVGTDGPGGGWFGSAGQLARAVAATWRGTVSTSARQLVVCTGGEPLLQLDELLVRTLHEAGFEVAVETNGTLPAPPGIDWLCVSPKAAADLVLVTGDELKLVFPQPEAEPGRFEQLDFGHFYLQPMAGRDTERNTQLALRYCLAHPKWKLSLQIHKILDIE
jgi:7-carboxy-7-deazaguanine synthase